MEEAENNNDQLNYNFSKEEIESFIKTKQDYLDGKTSARPWSEVREELEKKYGYR